MAEAHFSGHIDEETLAEYDELMDSGPDGSRSRSDALRESIKLTIAYKRALRTAELEFDTAREERLRLVEAVRRMAYEY